MGFCQLWLTCKDETEANKITQVLLDKHLIACGKQIPVSANYWWEGNKENDTEILLIMESLLNNFDKIEEEVAALHSYDTFVLQAIPMLKVSKAAKKWLTKEIKV